MQYQIVARHAHQNTKLNKYLGVGDIVDSEDPYFIAELLGMRGGHSYGHASFGAHSGQGFPYFSPENFTVRELRVTLTELEAAKKVEADAQKAEAKKVAEEAAQKAEAEATAKKAAEEAAKKAEAEAKAKKAAEDAKAKPKTEPAADPNAGTK